MIIFFQGGSTGNEIKDLVLKSLSDAGVDKLNVMNINTDGCSTMLGKAKGAVTLLRLEIATLPEWGGCTAHDLSNILKAAVKALCPYLTDIFAALFGCLSKHSMKKKRAFEFVSGGGRAGDQKGAQISGCEVESDSTALPVDGVTGPGTVPVLHRAQGGCRGWSQGPQ